jgi:hypothetical protein
MSKRGGHSTRLRTTKVKKRHGVGSRTITVLDSDEEDAIPKAADEYARVTKTRVATSGKAEKVVTSNIQISEVEKVDIHPQLEADTGVPADTVENVVRAVPAKKRKKQQKANDSVSGPIP